MTKYFPKTLSTLYRGCRAWTFNGFTNNDVAVRNINRQHHEICNSGHGIYSVIPIPCGRVARVQICRVRNRGAHALYPLSRPKSLILLLAGVAPKHQPALKMIFGNESF
jgi:hypothetical protein